MSDAHRIAKPRGQPVRPRNSRFGRKPHDRPTTKSLVGPCEHKQHTQDLHVHRLQEGKGQHTNLCLIHRNSSPLVMASQTRSSTLRETTHSFCRALIAPPPPSDLLAQYFSSAPQITEHGPEWSRSRLPFLAKTFVGREGCEEYFKCMTDVLDMALPDDAFPGKEEFIVDAEAGMVSVVGKGRFTSKKTGKGWNEQFIYRFSGFDKQGRIGHWEIWADPLSAWEAIGKRESSRDLRISCQRKPLAPRFTEVDPHRRVPSPKRIFNFSASTFQRVRTWDNCAMELRKLRIAIHPQLNTRFDN
ncbi:transcription elongation factor s-ii [Pyrenophora seminiperda CCB06]|uniref:Transcription elongation factor s-ii n=1 Tax=Pyrenophora seminiperda CCB06 TaxID=1302712 RepID=A0A3M7LX66_9PLEO|nr:transcription elongation factor s-ii [Pyrenophora seminiperda CCB06]